jgi:threonine/homoserine/homoserine lactone efflux protein
MDFILPLSLLLMGFAIGMLGALMPGPLFVYTVNESLIKGKWTGAKVIIGHALVEVLIFILLVLGLLSFAQNPEFVKAINLIGGAAMIIMALFSLRSLNTATEEKIKKTGYGLIVGGINIHCF